MFSFRPPPQARHHHIKEGYLLKQARTFQRWRRRFFRVRGQTLQYGKDSKVSLVAYITNGRVRRALRGMRMAAVPDHDARARLNCMEMLG